MNVRGTFEITMHAEPPHDDVEGTRFARMRGDKRFSGPLEATSSVDMTAVRTPVDGSAVYVAVEAVRGALEGKRGSFVLAHLGIMTRGAPSLTVVIVPDSGTGELVGLEGTMKIEIVGGQHHYELDYRLPA
jgi:hypothetical protein